MNRKNKVFFSMMCIALSAAFLVGGYEFIRSPAESIFLHTFGADYKPYALSAVPVMMGILIYCYGWMLSKLGSLKALLGSMIFAICVFVFSFFAVKTGNKAVVFFIFIFKESYIVILVEQYWSFINSTLKSSEAKVYNGPIAGFGAFGPIVAGFIISRFALNWHTESFILFSAAVLVPAGIFAYLGYFIAGEPVPDKEEVHGKKGHLHLTILKENRTVLLIAVVIFLTQVLSTVLDLRFSQLVQDAIPDKDSKTGYLGGFWMKVNAFSFIMQFLLTPLLLKFLPIRHVQVSIPLVHLITCGFLIVSPSLAVASISFLLFKGLDYSIFRASKETLYIPFSYDTRYRAKQVADAFTYRFSKGFISICLSFVKTFIAAIPGVFYPLAGFVTSILWMILAFPLTGKNKIKN